MEVNKTVFAKYESEVRGYCRHFDSIFVSAKGSIIKDIDNNEYIDFLAACGAMNYGHNDPDMSTALIDHIQSNGLTAGLDLFSVAKGRFLETFYQLILAPRKLDYRLQFSGPTGTNAVEAALKLARKVTGRTNVVAFTNGFHGVTLGALAATGNKYNRMGAVLGLPGVTRAPFDGYFGAGLETAYYLEKLLSDPSSGIEPPAAILLETVQGEGGLNAASAPWLQTIAAIAKKHGALLIVDDVQAGCGRTGTFFSFEHMGIEPDLVVLSKSISGFGLPMALLLIKPEYDQWRPAEHNGTFRGNTHAFVTAQVALQKFWADTSFSQEIFAKARHVTTRLQGMAEWIPGATLKGRGMMQGLNTHNGPLAAQIGKLAFRQGLIIETAGPYDEVLKILAPLTIPLALLDQGLDILENAVHKAMESGELAPRPTLQRRFPDIPAELLMTTHPADWYVMDDNRSGLAG